MKTIKAIFAALAVLSAFAIASTYDYIDEVLYSMPKSAYRQIIVKLGDGCTDKEIVNEYMNNKSYYDSLNN